MTKSCEIYEIELSSLLDGEASPEAAAEAVEHALDCAACGAFFRAARRLNRAARRTVKAAPVDEARAAALWREVERRTQEGTGGAARWRGLRAAALVVLGLGGGYLAATLGDASPAAVERAGEAVAADVSAENAMDERRFVALAGELLASEVRYQRAMLEVLRLVPALETGEGFAEDGETSAIVRASNRSDAPSSGLL